MERGAATLTRIEWRPERQASLSERNSRRVTFAGCARVHLGSLNLSGQAGCGGGVGFSVPNIGFSGSVELRESSPVHDPLVARIHSCLARLGMGDEAVCVSFDERIPAHVGLGSETQMIVTALIATSTLLGVDRPTINELAEVGLGSDSSIGVRLALEAGFIVDVGAQNQKETRGISVRIPQDSCFRCRPPQRWAVLVTYPEHLTGPSGAVESNFWGRVLPTGHERTVRAMQGVLSGVLPGLLSGDFKRFVDGLQVLAGGSTKPDEWLIQDSETLALREILVRSGSAPLLSSLGPAMVVFAERIADLRPVVPSIEQFGWRAELQRFGRAAEFRVDPGETMRRGGGAK